MLERTQSLRLKPTNSLPRFGQSHLADDQKTSEKFPIFVPKVLNDLPSMASDQPNTRVFNRTRSTRVRKRRTADFALEGARELEMILTDVNKEEAAKEELRTEASPPFRPKQAWVDEAAEVQVGQKVVVRRRERRGNKPRPVSLVDGLLEKGGDAVKVPSPLVSESISMQAEGSPEGSKDALATDINNILNPERLIRSTQSRRSFKVNRSQHSVHEGSEQRNGFYSRFNGSFQRKDEQKPESSNLPSIKVTGSLFYNTFFNVLST